MDLGVSLLMSWLNACATTKTVHKENEGCPDETRHDHRPTESDVYPLCKNLRNA